MASLCNSKSCAVCRQYDADIKARRFSGLPDWVRRSVMDIVSRYMRSRKQLTSTPVIEPTSPESDPKTPDTL